MLRKIKFKEFKDLYRKHIVQDFPSSERPNLEGFRRRILKHNEQVFIYEENETEKEKNTQEKRIKFYQKSNFEIVPNLNVKLFMVNFKIMIYQKENKEINIQEVIDRINGYYSKIIDKKRLSYIEFETTK